MCDKEKHQTFTFAKLTANSIFRGDANKNDVSQYRLLQKVHYIVKQSNIILRDV